MSATPAPRLASQLVNGVLAIKPIAQLAKHQARSMMIKRAEAIGVYWREEVRSLRSRRAAGTDSRSAAGTGSRQQAAEFDPNWETELLQVQNPQLEYPDYYFRPFHAYNEGNLSWESAMEVEVAVQAVHAHIWPEAGAQGDAKLRQSYHDVLKQIPAPQDVLDLGCGVGMSSLAMQSVYPQAQITGLDLSPYFLAIAQYRDTNRSVRWLRAAAEATGLPDRSFDLVSAFLLFHELPREAAIAILQEARRLLRPGGHFTLMDMNPQSEIHAKMPPYILTLLKSTEPYLDDYFTFDIEAAIESVGFMRPTLTCNSPRHRTIVAQVR